MQKKYTVVDLFAGVGGLSYGFSHNDNFEIIFANEYDKNIAKAYSLNHTTVKIFDCDIKELTEQNINKIIKEPIDIVVGGPPCQSYSTLGKRQNDERAVLFKEYCRILKILQPKIFIFENVKGMLSMNKGNLFNQIKQTFTSIGYEIQNKILNSAEYGVPQIRERVFIVGTKSKNTFEYPLQTHGDNKAGLKPFVSLKDAISDLPILESGETLNEYQGEPQNEFQQFVRDTTILTENTSPKNGELLIKIMKSLSDGGNKNDLPSELKPKSGYGNTYAKLWWNKPVPTVTRNFACASSSRCIHPRDSRALTTREGARLQSFPDSYKFYGSVATKNLEIGNAVPPLLSIALTNSVLDYLQKENK